MEGIIIGFIGRRISPNWPSYFRMFSVRAPRRRLACSGVMMMRLATCILGMPGMFWAKSRMNSLEECVMMARLA